MEMTTNQAKVWGKYQKWLEKNPDGYDSDFFRKNPKLVKSTFYAAKRNATKSKVAWNKGLKTGPRKKSVVMQTLQVPEVNEGHVLLFWGNPMDLADMARKLLR